MLAGRCNHRTQVNAAVDLSHIITRAQDPVPDVMLTVPSPAVVPVDVPVLEHTIHLSTGAAVAVALVARRKVTRNGGDVNRAGKMVMRM